MHRQERAIEKERGRTKLNVSPCRIGQYTAVELRALCRSDSLLWRFNCSRDLNCLAQSKHINPGTSENSNSTSAGGGIPGIPGFASIVAACIRQCSNVRTDITQFIGAAEPRNEDHQRRGHGYRGIVCELFLHLVPFIDITSGLRNTEE